MKSLKVLAGVTAAAAAISAMAVGAFAYDINTDLMTGWSASVVIPASEFENVTEDTTITITYKTDDTLSGNEAYWCIKPHRQDLETWQFMADWKGVTLSDAGDSYSVDVDSSEIKFRLSADPVTINGEEVCGSLEAAKINGIAFMGHGLELLTMTFSDEPLDDPADTNTDATDEDNVSDDADTQDTPTAGDCDSKPNTNTGAESIAIAAGVAVIAAGAAVVSRKRK